MRINDTIILKKNRGDIKKNYNDNDFYIILNPSYNRILKYYFIDIAVAIEKEELIIKLKYNVLNNVNYNDLIVI